MAQTLLPKDPKARLRFETLLADVSSRFVKLPAGRIGEEVEESLREMAVFFDADRCALLDDIDLASHFPWSYERLIRQGQPMLFERAADLPPEAEKDRQSWAEAGIRSSLYIPVFIGEGVRYVLMLQSVHEERALPEEYVPRLRRLRGLYPSVSKDSRHSARGVHC